MVRPGRSAQMTAQKHVLYVYTSSAVLALKASSALSLHVVLSHGRPVSLVLEGDLHVNVDVARRHKHEVLQHRRQRCELQHKSLGGSTL